VDIARNWLLYPINEFASVFYSSVDTTQDWDTLGNTFAKEKSVVIAKVDCDAHKELCGRYDVHGYPTLKWFAKGSDKPEEYVYNYTILHQCSLAYLHC
jgi:hypothetical protein